MKCKVCGRVIGAMIFQGTSLCCDMCRKIDSKELSTDDSVAFLISVCPGPVLTPWEDDKFNKLLAGSLHMSKKKYTAMRAEASNGR